MIFEANDALTGETEAPQAPAAVDGGPAKNDLYEWAAGRLRLVNVLPNGRTEPGAVFGSGGLSATEAHDPNFSHAISADGSRIFWTGADGHVYVREHAETTVMVPDGGGGLFLTASTDGSKVLLSDGRIYTVGETQQETVPASDLTEGNGGFQGILGASDDLSSIYFVDTARLGGEGTAGADNLYLWREGSTVLVATLEGVDNRNDFYGNGVDTGDWVFSPSDRTAQVTPDGEFLAFMKGEEVYEYDASTNDLVCASCNPTGERPLGPSALSLIRPGSGFMPQPSNLLADGRLFFDSYDSLSPYDTNNGYEDVYEYELDGQGSCTRPAGCVFLISGGNEDVESSFVNATPSGDDVFFTTSSRLLPEDQDDLVDLYDARVGGGFPPQPSPQQCATSEACKGPALPPPALETMLSTTFAGIGNLTPAPPSPVIVPQRTRALTRAQKLTKALKACAKQRAKKRRAACRARARKRYGASASTGGKRPAKAAGNGVGSGK